MREEITWSVFCKSSQCHLAQDVPAKTLDEAKVEAEKFMKNHGHFRIDGDISHDKWEVDENGRRIKTLIDDVWIKEGLNGEWRKED